MGNRTIEVTFELTKRYSKRYSLTDEQFKTLQTSWDLIGAIGIDEYGRLQKDTVDFGDYESDYAIVDEEGKTIVDWD